MALINCKECGKQVSDKAESCPHCGAPMKSPANSNNKSQQTDTKAAQTGCIGCLSIIIFLFLLGGIISMCTPKEEKEKKELEDVSRAALIHCRNAVKDRLKAPSTADIPLFDQRTTKIGENKFKVESYVDAQNSFGAKIRNNYTCEIERIGTEGENIDGKNWQIIDVQIGE
jgi:ribosomal protein L37E